MSQVDMAQPTLRNRRRHRQIETMRNTASALQITNITKTFGHTVAVKNASLEIPHGQVVALLGKNGAGKTTLVDITLGLQQQDSGTAKLFNVSSRQAIRRSLVGVVHQTGALLGEYTVGQTLKLFAATSALTVLASFASGMFIPLNQMGQFWAELAPWTPFYGLVAMAQCPLFGLEHFEVKWLVNYLVWTGLFAALAIWSQRRDTGR